LTSRLILLPRKERELHPLRFPGAIDKAVAAKEA